VTTILVGNDEYNSTSFKNEAELEKIVVENYETIFGDNTYYFDLKKGLKHKKGDLLTIPDGYLLRFGRQPSFTIVENEMSTHDIVKHIGLQFVKFNSALTDASKYNLKKSLINYLNENPKEEQKIEELLASTPFKNSSDLLDSVVMENNIEFAIIIDDSTEELERVVSPFNPEIIVIKKFENQKGEPIYQIDSENNQPEIKSVINKLKKKGMRKNPEIDTLVCPAQEEGFKDVFLKDNRWFAIRISPKRIPKIKYLAMYETKPISAIRYVGKVKEIKPYKNTGKFEVVLEGPATKIKPIKRTLDNPNFAPQAPQYTIKSLIDKASKLEDIF
jgi:hypothetical protein